MFDTGRLKKSSRIVVAMSGGVDSSVAAGWLKSQGYDVIGISLQLHDMSEPGQNKFGTCCSLSDIMDARQVAEKIGIPFYVSNMEQEFGAEVVDDFVREYLNGRTPNPCVRCNEKVKFSRLMDWALDLGADFLATGHYAQIHFDQHTDRYELHRGNDANKDQTYFLFTLRQKDLAHTLFPVGDVQKPRVRELARELGLRVADKPDSHEICFVKAKNYSQFIESKVDPRFLEKGAIVDPDGLVVGQHDGIHHFTIGQRKGIGVASSEPLYVLRIKRDTNEVVVGPEQGLMRRRASASNINWILPPELDLDQRFEAKIRYRAKESGVALKALTPGATPTRVEVCFDQPQRAITPGQAVVFYRGRTVYGGGWIDDLMIDM